jgi:peptide/nickel transport system substrate-binding protein
MVVERSQAKKPGRKVQMSHQGSLAFSRRSVIKAGGAAGAAMLLPAAGRQGLSSALAQDATPVAGGTLTFGTSPLPKEVFSPVDTISTTQNTVNEATFLRLVYGRAWGDGMNPDPNSTDFELGLAETMTEIEPDRIWEFTLREGLVWHDGNPVTVDDLIFGIWLGLNKDFTGSKTWTAAGILGAAELKANGGGIAAPPYDITIPGATKVGDRGIRIELEKATPNYWVTWTNGYFAMPKHILGELPLDQMQVGEYATKPIGNGPFKVTNYVSGQYAELEAFDGFYGGRPLIDKLIVRFGDNNTLAAAIESGEIDGTSVSLGPDFDRLTGLPTLVGNPVPSTLPIGFAVNRDRFPETGGTINKAIMHAIDVPTLSEQLNSGALIPSNYLFGHVYGLETPPDGFPTYEYDPEKAKALLAEISWDPNQKLDWIMWSPSGPLQDAMQAMLKAVGLNAEYKLIDAAAVVPELYEQANYDLVHANFQGSQDMSFLWVNIKSDLIFANGGFNYARYKNAKVDELWQQALDTEDPAARKALWDQVSLALAEDPPQATLWRGSVGYVWNRRVQGAYPYQYQSPVRGPFERIWLSDGV